MHTNINAEVSGRLVFVTLLLPARRRKGAGSLSK